MPDARIRVGVDGAVNASYKAAALRSLDAFDGLGAMDVLHQRALAASGAGLVADDSIRVVHDQSLGVAGTILIHFHAGRTMSGFRRQHLDGRQVLRLAMTPLIPLARFLRVVALTVPRGHGATVIGAAPAIWLLLVTQTVGQIIGYVAGPGDSPRRVQ